jgi:hypothetical protein
VLWRVCLTKNAVEKNAQMLFAAGEKWIAAVVV